jgi:Chaperone of endosialidase
MPVTEIKRPNFYEGQYLGAQDLIVGQEYQRQQDQRHRLAGHTWGIAVGLELDEHLQPGSSDAVDVYIKPGYAVDGFGRAIVVLEPYKIPEALFAQFSFDPALPNGRLVPVWIRYREEKTNPPAPGFAVCDSDDQAYRILESFRVVVGDLPSINQQRDQISVAGKSLDAADEIPDGSVSYQEFPDDGGTARWLIPLGAVLWLAPNPPVTTIGHFVKQSDADKQKARNELPYVGLVAKTLLAPAGKVRIKDREKLSIIANETGDLVGIEGSLRVDEGSHFRGVVITDSFLNIDSQNLNNGTLAPGPSLTFGLLSLEGIASQRNGIGNVNGLDFYTKNIARLSITNDGNVGIGKTTAVSKLQIGGDLAIESIPAGSARALPANGTLLWNDGTWLRLNQNLDFTKPIFGVHTPGVFAPGSLNVGGAASWGDPGFGNAWITGTVGIGTATPARKLHIEGTEIHSGGDLGGVSFGNRGTPAFVELPANGERWVWYSFANTARLWSGSDKLAITPAGTVGIGTTAPATKLHVIGDRVRLESAGKRLDLRADGSSVDLHSESNDLFLRSSGPGGNNRLLLNPFSTDGNVGIGTTNPGFKLDVAGQAHASSFTSSSDDRFKTNIRPLENVLEKIQKIRGVSFEWNKEYSALGRATGKPEFGVLAQEVEIVFPELVSRWGDQKYLAVDYGRLSAVLLEAIKELSAQNAALSSKVGKVEKQIAAGEKRRGKKKHETKT